MKIKAQILKLIVSYIFLFLSISITYWYFVYETNALTPSDFNVRYVVAFVASSAFIIDVWRYLTAKKRKNNLR